MPGPSHAGTAVIRWSLLEGLRSAGVAVGFYFADQRANLKSGYKPQDSIDAFKDVRFWFNQPGPRITPESTAGLKAVIDEFKPDVIFAYGMRPVRLVRATGYEGRLAIMSIDMEFMPRLYRDRHMLMEGNFTQKLRTVALLPGHLFRAAQLRRNVRRHYRLADFVINHAAHHAEWHRHQHERPTLYTPNPVAKLFDEAPKPIGTDKPRFLLLGGLAGTATINGLEWFVRHVYPRIEPAIAAGKLEVHLAGRNALSTLDQTMPLVVQRGYVEDLAKELQRTRAMLVPTPIKLGFRTRILDGFRHGVAVIAHTANAAGMPELIHGQNCLLASTGQDFADCVMKLAEDPAYAARLGRAGFEEFQSQLNADVVARKMVAFVADEPNRMRHQR